MHRSTPEGLVEYFGHLFNLCARLRLNVHPDKCMIFSSKVRWCGLIISADGWRFDPANIAALCKMKPPQTGSQLKQFLCALRWVRTALTDFSRMTAPLQGFLESVYQSVGKHTRSASGRVSLVILGWSIAELQEFEACMETNPNVLVLLVL